METLRWLPPKLEWPRAAGVHSWACPHGNRRQPLQQVRHTRVLSSATHSHREGQPGRPWTDRWTERPTEVRPHRGLSLGLKEDGTEARHHADGPGGRRAERGHTDTGTGAAGPCSLTDEVPGGVRFTGRRSAAGPGAGEGTCHGDGGSTCEDGTFWRGWCRRPTASGCLMSLNYRVKRSTWSVLGVFYNKKIYCFACGRLPGWASNPGGSAESAEASATTPPGSPPVKAFRTGKCLQEKPTSRRSLGQTRLGGWRLSPVGAPRLPGDPPHPEVGGRAQGVPAARRGPSRDRGHQAAVALCAHSRSPGGDRPGDDRPSGPSSPGMPSSSS